MNIMARITLIFGCLLSVTGFSMDLADARQLDLGTTVTVEGYVTVASGSFTGSTFDQGFAIQDDTAGIYVSIADNPDLNLNAHVRVTGTLAESFNLLILQTDLANIEVLPGAKRQPSAEVATGDINETTEGLLIAIEGTVTRGPQDDLPYGWKLWVDDGSGEITIFIPSTVSFNPFDVPWLVPGVDVRLTGFSGEFDDHYELNPRRRGDLVKMN